MSSMSWQQSGGRFMVVLGVIATLAFALSTQPARAGVRSGHSVVVSMGDSYIVGAAGRWQGNSLVDTGSRSGTDRACVPGPTTGSCASYDIAKVYPQGAGANTCGRSLSAEVLSAAIRGVAGLDLACGGAVTANVLPRAHGGKPQYKGQPTQDDALVSAARKDRVRMIILSVGGNDFEAANVPLACGLAYLNFGPASACATAKSTALAKAASTTKALERTIASIRDVMRHDGYKTSDYRLVVQDYPVPLPPASQTRYPQTDTADRINSGCPLDDSDLNFFVSKVMTRLDAVVETAATHEHAEFLELDKFLDGHELCSRHDSLVPAGGHPSAASSEWVRFFSITHVLAQAAPENMDFAEGEMLHPNYYAQEALGTCVTKLYAAAIGQHTCTTPGGGTKVKLTTKRS